MNRIKGNDGRVINDFSLFSVWIVEAYRSLGCLRCLSYRSVDIARSFLLFKLSKDKDSSDRR